MKVIDVNVLLYACNTASEHHATIHRWWESAVNSDESIAFAWSTIVGFLRMMTNPIIFDRPMSSRAAAAQVSTWLALPNCNVVTEKSDHWNRLRDLLDTSELRGNLVPDAHLAALASSYGATLVSCDQDFGRFDGLRWENPLKSAA